MDQQRLVPTCVRVGLTSQGTRRRRLVGRAGYLDACHLLTAYERAWFAGAARRDALEYHCWEDDLHYPARQTNLVAYPKT